MTIAKQTSIDFHIQEVLKGNRKFENVFEAVSRMILEKPNSFTKVNVNGKIIYDFDFFRKKEKHLVGLYNEVNSFGMLFC